ncbi:MAG: AEC family transporter [Clostridia bacterium]|nr:AEC family transporter [Clostridia bacterium]
MELALTVAIQVLIIFILISIGFILTKSNKLNENGVKQLTDILLIIVTPCVIIQAYQKEFDVNYLKGLFMAAIASAIIHIIAVIVSYIFFKKEESLRYRVSRFSSICSNCGFMAIPLLSAALGSDGVFYGSSYLVIFTLFYWTFGVYICTEDIKKCLSLKSILINPGVIGVIIGLVLFFTQIKLPYVLSESVSFMASLNTPLAMLILGSYLVKVDVKKAFKNTAMYFVCFVRLILIPLLAVFILSLLKIDPGVSKAVLICAACPVATVTSLFATKYDLDSVYASETVAISTIISILTIPLIIIISTYFI